MKTQSQIFLHLNSQFRLFTKRAVLVALLFTSLISYSQYCGTPDQPELMLLGGGGGGNPDCQSHLNYFPDVYSPILYVKVNFHFMAKEDAFDPHNFVGSWDGINISSGVNAYSWSDGLEDMMNNSYLNSNVQMNLPPGNTTPTLPYNFRIKVMGVYVHEDNNYWDACNDELGTLVTNYGVNTSSEINVFFSNYIAGTNDNDCYSGGYGPGQALVKGAWQDYQAMVNGTSPGTALADSHWSQARLLLHELGHCLSLGHTLNSQQNTFPFCGGNDDFCADTPSYTALVNNYGVPNPCCYAGWPISCDQSSECTNNLMDYNCGRALTPEQLGRIFKTLLNTRIDVIYEDYCTNNPDMVTTIASGQTLVWNQRRIFKGDVIIEGQSTVTVKCTVYMPEGAKFIVKPGAKLIIDGGTITHRCGGLWEGIEVWGNSAVSQTTSNQGVVQMMNDATIANARTAIRTIKNTGPNHYSNLDW
jgi:hypothetical protein